MEGRGGRRSAGGHQREGGQRREEARLLPVRECEGLPGQGALGAVNEGDDDERLLRGREHERLPGRGGLDAADGGVRGGRAPPVRARAQGAPWTRRGGLAVADGGGGAEDGSNDMSARGGGVVLGSRPRSRAGERSLHRERNGRGEIMK